MGQLSARRRVTRYTLGPGVARASLRDDQLTVEEPLEVRVDGRVLTVTMRTPGHDLELALGLLVSEGIVHGPHDVRTARLCTTAENTVEVTLADAARPRAVGHGRVLPVTSACGLCGADSIDAVRTRSAHPLPDDGPDLDPAWLLALPDRMRAAQVVFARTGSLHAAALVDVERDELLVVREDVGRHNAVDKVIGWAVQQGRLPLPGTVLVVSGRAGFELVQKASMAGIPAMVAVSAPSSLAVDLAVESGLTLVGFARGDSMVVYAGDHRVVAGARDEDRAPGPTAVPA
ncbi:formate dehydrogenase accessory sulfurtransferase FdhD [Cellulosimicrobium terreum]|nr:formate dehydrogenase accessory sulfurtransferase FdhD [Cellulosimicrobium terreum]